MDATGRWFFSQAGIDGTNGMIFGDGSGRKEKERKENRRAEKGILNVVISSLRMYSEERTPTPADGGRAPADGERTTVTVPQPRTFILMPGT